VLPFAAVGAIFLACRRPQTSGGARFPILIAASPLLFFHSVEARAYALLAALGFLLFLAVFRFRDPRMRLLFATIAAGLLPWVHYLGTFVVAGSIGLCAIRKRYRLALAQIAALVPFLLWLPVAIRQPPASLAWGEETWQRSLSGTLGILGFWGRPAPYFSSFVPSALWAGMALGAALLVATAVVARRDRAVRDALAFAAIPLLLAALAGFRYPIYFSGRTEMAILPIVLWSFSRAARRSRTVRSLTAVAAVLGSVFVVASLAEVPSPPAYRITAKFISKTAAPGDLVVASDADYLPLRLEKDRGALAPPLVGLPERIESHPGWFIPGERVAAAQETPRLASAIARVGPEGRILFAIPPDPAPRSLVLPFLRTGRVAVLPVAGADPIIEVTK